MVLVKSEALEIAVEPLSEEEVDIFAVEIPEHLESVAKTFPDPYHVKINVFDGQKAVTILPPLRGPDVNFAIELDKSKLLPKPSHPYQMNQEERAKCCKLLDDRVNTGIMEPADLKCPIAAPMFFVWKKDGTQWLVIDYRKLNEIMVKDSYLLPCINEMMDWLHRSEYFTKFDLKSGYNQIWIRPGDEWKTMFMTPFGPYRMKVMTFGFANAPPCFQQYMDKVFTLLLYKGVEIYLDDILMHHKTESKHVEGVLSVLQCLENAGLYCNPKKCEFHQKKMEFLSVNVSSDGFKMEDKKIADVRDWECPTSIRGVREFIGFVNFYRQWIPGFTNIAQPLHDLFQKNQSWQWTENEQHAFKLLKLWVSQAPVLVHADPNKQFQMETNASNYAYGAVLSQKQADNQHHLIGFMSKSMNPTKQNYGIPDKEALTIVKGLQNWRH